MNDMNQTNTELLSVVIPVYNAESTVDDCYQSVRNNTYPFLEMVMIDDGSIDRSNEILNGFALRDPDVIVVSKKNGGASSARNFGLNVMNGCYFAPIDSDDLVAPDMFETLISLLDTHNAEMSVCSMKRLDNREQAQRIVFDGESPDEQEQNSEEAVFIGENFLLNSNWNVWGSCCGKVYRVGFLENKRYPEDLRTGEDSYFNLSLFGKADGQPKDAGNENGLDVPGTTVVLTKRKLYYYIENAGSLGHSAKHTDKVLFCEKILDDTNRLRFNGRFAQICSMLVLKYALSCRYECSVGYGFAYAKRFYDPVLKSCFEHLQRSEADFCSKKKLAEFRVLIACPRLYRMYRLTRDRNLYGWEKRVKQSPAAI